MSTIARHSLSPAQPASRTNSALTESRLRGLLGGLLGAYLFLASLGLSWDIRWHGLVGRDSFFTPPHILLYTGLTVAGFICIAAVLIDTLRYRRGVPGVTAGNTTSLFGVFHAPLGFIVAGFGLLALVVAAPFDNYWHELYGLDVTLWAPFHVMGMAGGAIAAVGTAYVFASAAHRSRAVDKPLVFGLRAAEIATLLVLAGLLNLLVVGSSPALLGFPTLELGPASVLLFPLLLAPALLLVLGAAVSFTRRPGAATILVLMYTAWQAVLAVAVPLLIRWQVDAQGLSYRDGMSEPGFSLAAALWPLILLVPAALVDLPAWLSSRRASTGSWRPALPGVYALVAGLLASAAVLLLAPVLVSLLGRPRPADPSALLAAILPTLAAGVVGLWIGGGFGTSLRLKGC